MAHALWLATLVSVSCVLTSCEGQRRVLGDLTAGSAAPAPMLTENGPVMNYAVAFPDAYGCVSGPTQCPAPVTWSKILLDRVAFEPISTGLGVDARGNSYVVVTRPGPVDWGAGPSTTQGSEFYHHIVSYAPDASFRWSTPIKMLLPTAALAVDRERKVCTITGDLDSPEGQNLNPEQRSVYSLRCFDFDGHVLWSRYVGASFGAFARVELAFDTHGNVYFTGKRLGEAPLIESFTPLGTALWTNWPQANDASWGLALQALPDGNLACLARFDSSLQLAGAPLSAATPSMALFVFEPTGVVVWAQQFEDASDVGRLSVTTAGAIVVATGTQTRIYQPGGATFEVVQDVLGGVAQHANGLLAAQSWVGADSRARVLLRQLDEQLHTIWSATYASPGTPPEEQPPSLPDSYPADIVATDSGAIFIAGRAKHIWTDTAASREWFFLQTQLSNNGQ
jgi:hypothetical protein